MATMPPIPQLRPVEQPNLLGQASQIMALKGMQAQQQLQQGQQQLQQGQIQEQQQNLAARKALNEAFANSVTPDANGKPQFDPDKLQTSLMSGPAAYQTPGVMEGITKFQKTKVELQTAITDLQQKSADMIGGAAAAVKAAGYDPALAHSLLDTLPQSPQLDAIRQKIDADPTAFRQMIDSAVAKSPAQQKMQNERDVAGIRAGSVDMKEMNDWLQKNPGKGPSDYQQFKVDQGVEAGIKKETDPRAIAARIKISGAEAQIQQAIKNGSSKDAGEMLAKGLISPSEIAARSNPSFLVLANKAALKFDPNYNAQKADADFAVAKSPANVGFFGSAKSLTDKGGTLDQLEAAGKEIPQNQIPVFNTIEDAVRAAGGSGPIAKYASILVGVSDDYSKVMGGGIGSDASRAQGFKLASASASPEARAAAVQGIRGAVNSQVNSRIGGNKVLQNMYGQSTGQTQQPISAVAPNGHKIVVKDGKWVDAQTGQPIQ